MKYVIIVFLCFTGVTLVSFSVLLSFIIKEIGGTSFFESVKLFIKWTFEPKPNKNGKKDSHN